MLGAHGVNEREEALLSAQRAPSAAAAAAGVACGGRGANCVYHCEAAPNWAQTALWSEPPKPLTADLRHFSGGE